MLRTVATTVFLCLFDIAIAEPVPLSGQALSEMIGGAVVEIDTPLGTKLPITYGDDGRMSGRAGAISFYLGASTDNGRWWISGDMLCQKWERWFDAETQCMRIRKEGARIHWTSRDGKTGTGSVHVRVAAASRAAPPSPGVKPKVEVREPARLAAADLPAPSRLGGNVAALAPPSPVPSSPVPSSHGPSSHVPSLPGQSSPVPTSLQPTLPGSSVRSGEEEGQSGAGNAPPVPQFSKPVVKLTKTAGMVAVAQTATPKPDAGPQTDAKVVVTSAAPSSAVAKAAPESPVSVKAPASAPSAVRGPRYTVVRVAAADVLNVRGGPSAEHDIVGAIPPQSRGVEITGDCRSIWCPVRHAQVAGWVNRMFLESETARVDVIAGADLRIRENSEVPRHCLTAAARELLQRIEAHFGQVELISTCRPGATIAGSGRPSKHRDGNAIDFKAGARKQHVVAWLIVNHHSGGTMTYRGMDHIHVDIGPHFVALDSGSGLGSRMARY